MTAGRDLIDRVNWIVDSGLSIDEKMILLVLARHDGPTGCYPSLTTIARKAGRSRATVKKTLRELREGGLVQRTHRHEDGSRENTTSLYTLSLPLSQVGSAGTHVGSQGAHPGSVVADRWAQAEPGVGSNRAPEQPSLTAFIERPIPVAPSAPSGTGGRTKSGKGRKTPKQTALFEAPTSEHQLVKDCYFEEFKRAKQTDHVPFEGREGKAINQLIKKTGGADAACEAIRNAFAGTYTKATASILTISNDPARFVGKATPAPTGTSNIPKQPGRWLGDSEPGYRREIRSIQNEGEEC